MPRRYSSDEDIRIVMPIQLRKNFSLVATVATIVITSIVGYYIIGLKKAPYEVANFESFTFKWGVGDSLENFYSSANGDYQYLNHRDSLIRTHIKLRANDIILIHNKINEFGFWNFPNTIGKPSSNPKAVVYELQFNYTEKSKKLVIYSDFDENPQLLDSAMQIKNIVQRTIDEAEVRYNQ